MYAFAIFILVILTLFLLGHFIPAVRNDILNPIYIRLRTWTVQAWDDMTFLFRGHKTQETFQNIDQPAPIKDYLIGNYDGIKFPYMSDYHWLQPKLDLNVPIVVPQGTPLPLGYEETPSISGLNPVEFSNGPSVDGSVGKGVPHDMFMLAYNSTVNPVTGKKMVSPECCPSTFSTSTGCVCMTPEQGDFIASRGNNSTYPTAF